MGQDRLCRERPGSSLSRRSPDAVGGRVASTCWRASLRGISLGGVSPSRAHPHDRRDAHAVLIRELDPSLMYGHQQSTGDHRAPRGGVWLVAATGVGRRAPGTMLYPLCTRLRQGTPSGGGARNASAVLIQLEAIAARPNTSRCPLLPAAGEATLRDLPDDDGRAPGCFSRPPGAVLGGIRETG
jgi:hypothetical protein